MKCCSGILIAFASYAFAAAIGDPSDTCASLIKGADYAVNSTLVGPGELKLDGVVGVNRFTLCRVIGKIPYEGNSTLNFEVWLPEAPIYKGRYLSVGK